MNTGVSNCRSSPATLRRNAYRDLQLLDQVVQSPDATQRDLSKRMGIALGLANLMLRRLSKKGFIRVSSTRRRGIRYLITPEGMFERSRLMSEYIQYSLVMYGGARRFFRERLARLSRAGSRRILLYGTGELAEIAFLAIQELELELVGVANGGHEGERFLGHRVRKISEINTKDYDWLVVASLEWRDASALLLATLGIPRDRILDLAQPSVPLASLARGGGFEDVLTGSSDQGRTPASGSRGRTSPADPKGGPDTVVVDIQALLAEGIDVR